LVTYLLSPLVNNRQFVGLLQQAKTVETIIVANEGDFYSGTVCFGAGSIASDLAASTS
jgi:hypothetical protein